MARELIRLAGNPEAALERAATVLAGGGVAVFPTETVYGIGVAAGEAGALARLRRLKGRDPGGKPFQFLAADLRMARDLGALITPRLEKLARRFWPGPLTLVVPGSNGEGVGMRIPDSAFVLELCRRLGRAVVSSSANAAGMPPPAEAGAADVFADEVDLLVDGGRIAGGGVPSTVASCLDGEMRILRRGGVEAGELLAAWRDAGDFP
ncbi:MAG: L-threonylcarbamoyladenylate synthase [Planctomycetota bacterium]|jgi:L-threonylcarbamoyladenylate synthase|nr:L-threonylcarbamoyladenylate synthase [Planctomycetota bacterium]